MIEKPNKPLGTLYIILSIIWSFNLAIDILAGNHWILVLCHIILVTLNLICVEVWLQPIRRLVAYIQDQIYSRHLARLRHASYIQFRESVKGGDIELDEFEPEAKQVIK